MTAEEKLVARVLTAGSAGIKKADLRKEFGETVDALLEKIVSKGELFVDKRGSAYYCFHKDHYVQSLLNSDPRFRLIYDMIRTLEASVTRSNAELTQIVETLANNISNLARLVVEKNEQRVQPQSILSLSSSSSPSPYSSSVSTTTAATAVTRRSIGIYDFKTEFDAALSNSASSIGWVELAKVRNELCSKYNLTAEEFYQLVGELTSQHQDKYELSTGGGEGVMVRGLLHGFVRCIC